MFPEFSVPTLTNGIAVLLFCVPLLIPVLRSIYPIKVLQLANAAARPVSCMYSSSFNRNDAASTFSSRCSIDEVPGIGSIIGERFSNQASATCLGVLLLAFAIFSSHLPDTAPAHHTT